MPEELNWESLIFGSYSREEIQHAVSDPLWQKMRQLLVGTTLELKYFGLCLYLQARGESRETLVQVTNYINALKRGGMIK